MPPNRIGPRDDSSATARAPSSDRIDRTASTPAGTPITVRPGIGRVTPPAIRWLDDLARVELLGAGDMTPEMDVRREARAMLYGFAEYHLERRVRSFSLLVRQPMPALTP